LLRQRGERLERPFAHLYRTGRLRRLHVRGRSNIVKRVLVHVGACNLGLLMRTRFGIGTPRALQGRLAAAVTMLVTLWMALTHVRDALSSVWPSYLRSDRDTPHTHEHLITSLSVNTSATRC
jgi:transposase